jgi:hypothetical protein
MTASPVFALRNGNYNSFFWRQLLFPIVLGVIRPFLVAGHDGLARVNSGGRRCRAGQPHTPQFGRSLTLPD